MSQVRWIRPAANAVFTDARVATSPFGWLGASFSAVCPIMVKRWLPDECKHWAEYTPYQQGELTALAGSKEAEFNMHVAQLRARPGACDATIPGALAGALREHLVAKGGKVGEAEDTFGSAELAEWMRVFGKAPTKEDAEAAVGKTWFGPMPISLGTICPKGVTLPATSGIPAVVQPGLPAVQPVTPPATPVKGASMGGVLGLAAALLGAIWYATK